MNIVYVHQTISLSSQCIILTMAYLITYLVATIAEKSGLNTGLATGTSSLRLYLEVNTNRRRNQIRQVKVSEIMVSQIIFAPIKSISV
jgi:hypothetical protein